MTTTTTTINSELSFLRRVTFILEKMIGTMRNLSFNSIWKERDKDNESTKLSFQYLLITRF
jgi:hypothetical protein